MAKNWKSIRNNALKYEKNERVEKKFNNSIRNIKILDVEKLKKDGEELFKKRVEREDNILIAKSNNLLKSEKLIAEAQAIENRRKEKNNKTKEKE